MKKSSWTKTTSSRRTWANKKVYYTLVAGLLLLLAWWLTPRLLSTVASVVIVPVVSVENWLSQSTGALPSYLRDRNSLVEENRALEQAVIESKLAKEEKRKLEVENDELRLLLGGRDMTRLAAGVIGRPTDVPYDVLIIDKGSRHGVWENSPVYIGSDQAIGFVARVYENSAVVALVTTPGFESTVYIYGPDIYTTALGMGGGTLRVNVPQGIPLEEGNLVVMPSLSGGLYGAVSVVESVPSRPEQYGFVSMEIPMQSIHYVGIDIEPLDKINFDDAREVVESARRDFLQVNLPEGVLVDVPIDTATTTATTTP